MSSKKIAVGIDLGTTYSKVGVWQNDRVEIITNEQGNRTTPSYVAFTDCERLVGEAAKNQVALNAENTVFDAKRLIGRRFSDDVVQKNREHWPFKIVQKSGDRPAIQVTFMGETKEFFPEEISSMVLGKMKQIAEAYLGHPVTDAVITVPAYFNDTQRVATRDSGAIAGLNVLRIINEPTAASMAYGLEKRNSTKETKVLVFDFGGGTLDVSILSIQEGVFEVVACGGDTFLGGEDIDNNIVDYFVQEFKRKNHKDPSCNQRSIRRLRSASEKAKLTLSASSMATIEIDSFFEGIDFYSNITRARFEDINGDIWKRCMNCLKDCLSSVKMTKSDIDEVVLVGGSTRIPKVQELLKDFFGKEPNRSINPDEAVAYGASVQAAILTQNATGAASEVLLIDVTPLTLGVESAGGIMAPIIERNTTIPCTKSKMFSTNHDNQTSVTVKVYEGERTDVKDNHWLGQFTLEGIPPAPRAHPQIEVSFSVDTNGILEVSAEEKSSGKKQKLHIASDKGRLSKTEIERIMKDAEKYREQDKLRAEVIEWRNHIEKYIYNIQVTLRENIKPDDITPEEKQNLESLIQRTSNWLEENAHAALGELKQKQHELEITYNPIISKVYSKRV